jgi:prepilin-type N-terminal cleavage/methylation domain-containing protein
MPRSPNGFTLVELLMVTLIIGLLASITIPIFNEQRARAKNAVAVNTLQNAVQAASSYYISNGESFESINSVKLNEVEATISASPAYYNWTPGSANADGKKIYVNWIGGFEFNGGGVNQQPAGRVYEMCSISAGNKAFCYVEDRRIYTNSAWNGSRIKRTTGVSVADALGQISSAPLNGKWNP